MLGYPKKIRKLIREYGAKAREAELRRELQGLSICFDEWKDGEMTSDELSRATYKFVMKTARDIDRKYGDDTVDVALANAIQKDSLKRDEVPEKLLEHLAHLLKFYNG